MEEVRQSFYDGNEQAYLQSLLTGGSLEAQRYSEAEVTELAAQSEVLAEALQEMNLECEPLIWLHADMDQDGLEDVLIIRQGGTMGNIFPEFYQGDGKDYTPTYFGEEFTRELAIINYRGQNYLCVTTYDFGSKYVDGVKLEAFQDGKLVETAYIYKGVAGEQYHTYGMENTAAGYEKNAENIQEQGVSLYKRVQDYEIIMGDAESKTDSGVCADYNNDGKAESYKKAIRMTSNSYCDQLILEDEDEKRASFMYELQGENDGIPMMLWVEQCDTGNVVYLLFYTDIHDFSIVGYHITGQSCQKIMQLEFVAELEVQTFFAGSSEKITMEYVSFHK